MSQQDLLTLLNQTDKGDSKMQLLAQMLQQNNTESETTDSHEAVEKLLKQIKKQESLVKRLEASNKKLKGKIKFLIENLNYRIEVNDTLAAATGSCPDCWGEDYQCKTCNGQGKPGNLNVDEEAFMIFVEPVLKHYMGSGNNGRVKKYTEHIHNHSPK